MTASDQLDNAAAQLSQLSVKVGQTEANVKLAKAKGRAGLDEQIVTARDSAKQASIKIKTGASDAKDGITAQWSSLRKSWDEHTSKIHKHTDDMKSDHDAKHAEKHARHTEDDAEAAVAFASAALDEAYYQVLVAASARLAADEYVTASS